MHGSAIAEDYLKRILALEAEGLTRKQIAERLGLHINTVTKYLRVHGRQLRGWKHDPEVLQEKLARLQRDVRSLPLLELRERFQAVSEEMQKRIDDLVAQLHAAGLSSDWQRKRRARRRANHSET